MKDSKPGTGERVTVENINVPGYIIRIDAGKYHAMRTALLQALPDHEPGLTQTEIRSAVLPFLPHDLFPNGEKVGWWAKSVQLDLEAKKLLVREAVKPLRWHRLPD